MTFVADTNAKTSAQTPVPKCPLIFEYRYGGELIKEMYNLNACITSHIPRHPASSPGARQGFEAPSLITRDTWPSSTKLKIYTRPLETGKLSHDCSQAPLVRRGPVLSNLFHEVLLAWLGLRSVCCMVVEVDDAPSGVAPSDQIKWR
ncbi:hypothetical protein BHYA_0033g00030 [Botrytis hyacinthi]|uniref:Uncharacterized protein n=1 Tax=Botrytis hyacinthi TaxID=278943 RepID=A0A4Z1GZZ7_9HELO|nr:hypothetical protein BHYA_0033g00030 [Botrytis hyacinthi]